jgi:hypothetical protein
MNRSKGTRSGCVSKRPPPDPHKIKECWWTHTGPTDHQGSSRTVVLSTLFGAVQTAPSVSSIVDLGRRSGLFPRKVIGKGGGQSTHLSDGVLGWTEAERRPAKLLMRGPALGRSFSFLLAPAPEALEVPGTSPKALRGPPGGLRGPSCGLRGPVRKIIPEDCVLAELGLPAVSTGTLNYIFSVSP